MKHKWVTKRLFSIEARASPKARVEQLQSTPNSHGVETVLQQLAARGAANTHTHTHILLNARAFGGC